MRALPISESSSELTAPDVAFEACATFDADLATWKAALERRTAFLDRHLATPVTTG